jgi:ABC-type spermidine/putrescine transport system permease subunit I
MNDTEQIFATIFAFGVGYAIAYSVKNVRRIYKNWGLFICIFIFPTVSIILLMSAAMIADRQDIVMSSAFGAGFIIRMLKSR